MRTLPAHTVLVLLALMISAGFAAAGEDGPPVYRIENRWLKSALHAAGDRVAYGGGDDASYHWTLEDAGGFERVRNVATGKYMRLKQGSADTELADAAASDPAAQWAIHSAGGQWLAFKNAAGGLYANVERRSGFVECDANKTPHGDSLWSGQWKLVHVGGSAPTSRAGRYRVNVKTPEYGSTIGGETRIVFEAPGFTSAAIRCWKQGEGFGDDSTVATLEMSGTGEHAFSFPADEYPHGPIMLRIAATNGSLSDTCNLQLYNRGGVAWNEGIPASAPPAAEGMKLIFADDFDGPLSITATGEGATYASHKPGGGDFGSFRFADHLPGQSPFLQLDTYLRIRLDEGRKTAGLISSIRMDGTGITARVPCYFECRMTAQSAPGAWPAFWLMTRSVHKGLKEPADELDTVECYGGEGPGRPNQTGYWVTSHFWNQGPEGDAQPGVYRQIPMTTIGGGASWFTTFHVYGTKITDTDTIYYLDDIEVARHPTGKLSKTEPLFFFINFAAGGGWPVDLSRYNGIADMYVDYVRVFSAAPDNP